jgi:hypothetical protein
MAKGQQKSNKEVKKAKKSTEPMKTSGGLAPATPQIVTAIMPKGKEKYKK